MLVGVLAAFGMADAGYLTWQYYEAVKATWCDFSSFFSCSRVGGSPYASVAGIPTALLGFLGFLVLFLLVVAAFRGAERVGPWSVDRWLLVFGLAGALIGLGLTFVEVFVIQAICILCLIGFVLDLGILALAWLLVRSSKPVGV